MHRAHQHPVGQRHMAQIERGEQMRICSIASTAASRPWRRSARSRSASALPRTRHRRRAADRAPARQSARQALRATGSPKTPPPSRRPAPGAAAAGPPRHRGAARRRHKARCAGRLPPVRHGRARPATGPGARPSRPGPAGQASGRRAATGDSGQGPRPGFGAAAGQFAATLPFSCPPPWPPGRRRPHSLPGCRRDG
jgi:hypothetical protein